MKTVEDLKSLQTQSILRLNCPGLGKSLSLSEGEAQPLTEYSVIIVNPVSIAHLFGEDQEVLKQVEMSQAAGLTSCRFSDDKILERINQQIELRSPELFQFLAQGGLLIYYLCRPFVITGHSRSLDNYAWLCGLAPDQPGESTMSEQTVRHMSALAHGRNIDMTAAADQSMFRPYFEQVGLEWNTIIRTDFLTSGYSVLAQAGPKKCIAGELIAGDNGGRVIFFPAPYSPDFDRVLMSCVKAWYGDKMGLVDQVQENVNPAIIEESSRSNREKAESMVAAILADQAASAELLATGQKVPVSAKEKEAVISESKIVMPVKVNEVVINEQSLPDMAKELEEIVPSEQPISAKHQEAAMSEQPVSVRIQKIETPEREFIEERKAEIPKQPVFPRQEEVKMPEQEVATRQEETVVAKQKISRIGTENIVDNISQNESSNTQSLEIKEQITGKNGAEETIVQEGNTVDETHFDWNDNYSKELQRETGSASSSETASLIGPVPDWCKSYWLPGVDGLIKEIQVIRKQIKDLEKKLVSNENAVSSLEEIKSTLLSGKPGDLLASSQIVLNTLGWQSKPYDQDSNVLILMQNGYSEVVSSVSISPGSAERKELAKLIEILIRFWDSGGSEPKGILIVCTHCDTPISQRKEADFPESMIEFAKRKNICLIATTQLIALYLDVKLGKLKAENARQIILSTAGKLSGFTL